MSHFPGIPGMAKHNAVSVMMRKFVFLSFLKKGHTHHLFFYNKANMFLFHFYVTNDADKM